MDSIAEIIRANPDASDADVLAEYLAQQPERKQTPIQTVRSFMSDEMLMTPIKAVRDNANTPALIRYGLAEFVDGLANALTFNGLNDKVYALATQLIPALASVIKDESGNPILSAPQAATILSFVQDAPTSTLEDVVAVRESLRKQALHESWATIHNAVSAGIDDGSITVLPTVEPWPVGGGEG